MRGMYARKNACIGKHTRAQVQYVHAVLSGLNSLIDNCKIGIWLKYKMIKSIRPPVEYRRIFYSMRMLTEGSRNGRPKCGLGKLAM